MFHRASRYISAIDIGSEKIRAVIAQPKRRKDGAARADSVNLKILGSAEARSRGIQRGEIVDVTEAASAIRQAVEEACNMASVSIRNVVAGLQGRYTRAVSSVGSISLSGNHSPKTSQPVREITEADVRAAIDAAKSVTVPSNQAIVHAILQDFCVDGSEMIRNPCGKSGAQLEAHVQLVIAAGRAIKDLEKALREARLFAKLIVLQSLASARASLSSDDMQDGTLLIDIGKGTTDAVVFFAGSPRYITSVAMAGHFVTLDIARCLGCSVREAERVKLGLGCQVGELGSNDEPEEQLPPDAAVRCSTNGNLLKAVTCRYAEIFLTLDADIRRAGAEKYIRKGVVLTGGASCCPGVCELASKIFGVKARMGECESAEWLDGALQHPRFATVTGLLLLASEPAASANGSGTWSRHILGRH